ncbi:MAG: diacylglycerol kinase family protein [Acidobacteriota bacterium]
MDSRSVIYGAEDIYLAIINPAAGGGRCGRRAPAAVARLREAGLHVEIRETTANGDATRLAREAYREGYRSFIAAGGDGTCFEVLNGLAPHGLEDGTRRARLAVLPLGTGNSFLREFTTDGSQATIQALIEGRQRRCDVLRLNHRDGCAFYVNLFGFGFAADVTINTLRGRYKRYGALGYVLGVLHTVVKLRHPVLPARVAGGELDARPMTFLCVCNSRYTAGAMMMAPEASVHDGLADLVRVETLGRFDIIRTFPKIYRGTHLEHPAVSARSTPRIEFETDQEVEVMVDGEILKLVPQSIEVLPDALTVCI